MCSSIDDERGILHVQFRFRMNEIFKSEVGLKQELNMTKKSENSLIQHSKWYVNGCVYSANEHVYSKWLRPF